jgi:hypothetical protein
MQGRPMSGNNGILHLVMAFRQVTPNSMHEVERLKHFEHSMTGESCNPDSQEE